MKQINIKDRTSERPARPSPCVLDTALDDTHAICRHSYHVDPDTRGREISLAFSGRRFWSGDAEVRIITAVSRGKTVGTPSSVLVPAETQVELDKAITERGDQQLGTGHTHNFPGGDEFVSGVDREQMQELASLDPNHLFFIINPLESKLAAYCWNHARHAPERVPFDILVTSPILDYKLNSHEQPSKTPAAAEMLVLRNQGSAELASDILMGAVCFLSVAAILLNMSAELAPSTGLFILLGGMVGISGLAVRLLSRFLNLE